MRRVLALLIAAGIGAPGAMGARAEDSAAAEQHLRQGRHYLKNGKVAHAISELEAGLSLGPGPSRGSLVMALHRAFRKAGRFEEGMETLARFRGAPQADEAWDRLTQRFGRVRFVAGRAGDRGARGAVALQAPGLISAEKKEVFRQAQARLAAGVRLPAQAWLPFGHYRVGGLRLEHRPGGPTEVAVALPKIVVIAERRRDLDGAVVRAMGGSVGGELRLEMAQDLQSRPALDALLRWEPELVVTLGAGATQLARMALPTTPTVFAGVPKDLWKRMLRRGRHNVTGVATESSWPVVARAFCGVAKGARHVGMVVRGPSQDHAKYARDALRRLGVEATLEIVRGPADLAGALARVARSADSLWALPDTELWDDANQRAFVELCQERRVACLAPDEAMVEAGALMAVLPPDEQLGVHLAGLARLIVVEGRKAHDLPIAPPSHFGYVLNVAAAGRLGITLSEGTLRGAARLHGQPGGVEATNGR